MASESQALPFSARFLVPHSRATLQKLALLVIVGEVAGLAGYFSWHASYPDIAKAFGESTAVLLFGTLLGGVVKILLDDLEIRRSMRAAEAEFISNVLADLKSVYDRVERARSLILAHQSAKTYGEEVRDLIEYRVKLHNVARAIRYDPRGQILSAISENVEKMRCYLDVIVKEFEVHYKEISRIQNHYESEMKNVLSKPEDPGKQAPVLPKNSPWEEIQKLPSVQNWLGLEGQKKPDLKSDFLTPLDLASKALRDQLMQSLK